MFTAFLGTLRLNTTYAQPLALAQRIETQPHVLAHHPALVVADGAGFLLDVAVEELAERTFTNEANAGGILLLGVGQANLGRNAAHLGLGQLAHREQRVAQLVLVQPMQKSSSDL